MPDARRAPVGVGEVACRDEGRPGWEEGEREDGFRFPRRAQRQGSARRFGHGELQEPRDGTHQEGHADLVRAPEPSQGDTPRHITETRSLVGSRVSPSRLPRSLLGPLGARRSSLKRHFAARPATVRWTKTSRVVSSSTTRTTGRRRRSLAADTTRSTRSRRALLGPIRRRPALSPGGSASNRAPTPSSEGTHR